MMRRLEALTEGAASLPPQAPTSADASIPSGALATSSAPLAAPAEDARPQQRAAVARSTPQALAPETQSRPVSLSENLPVPVQFEFRKATFTTEGEEAAALLLKYFKARQFREVSLSGHADERGSDAANMKLSLERLQRIEQFLKAGGFTGELTLVPKGATEQFAGVDRSKFPREELYQLDRRVEVISAR